MLFEHNALVMGELLALLNMYIAQAGHNPVAWELHLQIVFRERHLHTLRNTVVQNTFAKSIFCKTSLQKHDLQIVLCEIKSLPCAMSRVAAGQAA